MKRLDYKKKTNKKDLRNKIKLKDYQDTVIKVNSIIYHSSCSPDKKLKTIIEVIKNHSSCAPNVNVCDEDLIDKTAFKRLKNNILNSSILQKNKYAITFVGMIHIIKRKDDHTKTINNINFINKSCVLYDNHEFVIEFVKEHVPELIMS